MCLLQWLRVFSERSIMCLIQWLKVGNGNGRDIKCVDDDDGRGFKYLNDNLVVEILRRLPAEQQWRCRRVCTRWNALISSRSFVQAHLQKAPSTVFVFYLLKCEWPYDNKTKFMDFFSPMDHYGGDDAKASCSSTVVMKRVFNGSLAQRWKRQMPDQVAFPVASCNGLVLFNFPYAFYIGNPITGDIVCFTHSHREDRFCGFFYHSSTQEYKLLHCHRRVTNGPIEYAILTLGSTTWRSIGAFPYIPRDGSPVTLNNTLYWMIADNCTCTNSIMMFFMEREKFRTLSHPAGYLCKPGIHHKWMHLLGMEGRLTCWCLWGKLVRVWASKVSENHIGPWTRIYSLNFHWNFKRYPFMPVDAYHVPQLNYDIQLVSIQNMELLLVWRNRGVFRYNLLTNTVTKVELEGIKQFHYGQGYLLLTNYTKSVVSLMNFYSNLKNFKRNFKRDRSVLKTISSTIGKLKNNLAIALLD